jgi:hypothetical protein
VPGRVGHAMVGLAFAFHIVTYATIGIIFLPHVVCLLSFVPLERLRVPMGVTRPATASLDAHKLRL